MKRIPVLMMAVLLVLAMGAPCWAAARNVVNAAPAIGGNNGRFVCMLLADVDYDATPTIAAAGDITTGITNPPAPALITIDPTTAPGGTDVLTITLTGTDYTGAAVTEAYTWTGSDHAAASGAKYLKTITKITTANTGSTYPGVTNFGYAAITRCYIPPYTLWVDFCVSTTSITVYMDLSATAPTIFNSAYTWASATTKSMGVPPGTWVYFGLSTTAAATDRVHVQCYR